MKTSYKTVIFILSSALLLCSAGCTAPLNDIAERNTPAASQEPAEYPTEIETEFPTCSEFLTPSPGYAETPSIIGDIIYDKPVIYLYPEKTTEVSVKLDYAGELICTYPDYGSGWNVIAQPDGTLTDLETGKEYSYLFWEGTNNFDYDMSKGFVVKGEDTAEFLQDKLSQMGLTPKEYNEFIVYWLPKMQNNAYNLITFQGKDYADNAKLAIFPEPDSILRVFMVYTALDHPIEIEEPEIENFERKGFTVIEWGGAEI